MIGNVIGMRLNRLPLVVLSVLIGIAAQIAPARAADCVSACDAATYCDGEMHASGECARKLNQCYITECNKPTRSFGALAYSAQSTASGYAFDQPSTAAADRRALTECAKHANDCKIVASFSNSCAAVAAGTNKRVSVAQANTGDGARSNAVSACSRNGGDKCEIEVWSCSFP